MQNLCDSLLTTWCDGLLKYQLRDTGSAGLDGGLLCPACACVHGRCAEAIYPLLHRAHETGEERYLQAALELAAWARNVEFPDGAWGGNAVSSQWKGTTVFGAIAWGDALKYHAEILDEKTEREWRARLHRAAEYLYEHITIETSNINYPATCSYAMALLGELFDEPRYLARGAELAHACLAFLSDPNKLLFGEGTPHNERSPQGCMPVDLGYNVEESLPALVLYAITAQDEMVLETVTESLRSHLEFMLPDGAWDNSWGTRNFKWTYWGSRTSDGCQPGYALLANRDPAFAEAARRNLSLLDACTHDGLLYGGPHYIAHGEKPCIHHTFCHAKTTALLLDHEVGALENLPGDSVPREEPYGIREFPEIQTWLIATGPWRATVTAYDWMYQNSCHATGGALTMLWHEILGPILTASLNEYVLTEPHNMQVNRDPVRMALTPRLELRYDRITYTNINDRRASMSKRDDERGIVVTSKACLLDMNQESPPFGIPRARLEYRFAKDRVDIRATIEGIASHTPVAFVLPVVSMNTEPIEHAKDGTIRIQKPDGDVTITANTTLAIAETPNRRVFNHVPGFEAIPIVAECDARETPEIQIRLMV